MGLWRAASAIFLIAIVCAAAFAQDPAGTIEGRASDPSGAVINGASVRVTNAATGYSRSQTTSNSGGYRLVLPAAAYDITVEAPGFARVTQTALQLNVSQTVRVDFSMRLTRYKDSVTVAADSAPVQASSNEIGNVVTGRELVDLPLNGRNFTQLGLLQAGASALTSGLAQAGGPLRQGQTYSVNGARPEQNTYLIDGGSNVNRMDGGFPLRLL